MLRRNHASSSSSRASSTSRPLVSCPASPQTARGWFDSRNGGSHLVPSSPNVLHALHTDTSIRSPWRPPQGTLRPTRVVFWRSRRFLTLLVRRLVWMGGKKRYLP